MGGDDDKTFGQKVSENWNGFKLFMWNGESRTFMGRSGKSWAKIGLFYLIYYICLAAFWAAMLFIFLQTIENHKPKWTAYVSTPGLSYAPSTEDNYISFTPDNRDTYKKLTRKLTDIYNAINETGKPKDGCNDSRCTFDVKELGPWCTPPNFGFDLGEPCLLVHLNRVYNWNPEEYDEVPEEVQEDYVEGNIAFACKPYKEKYVDNFNYTTIYPTQGIAFNHFPYNPSEIGGKKNYATPYIAIRFNVKPNSAAKVECRTYTGNIKPKRGLYDTDQESKFVVEFNIKPISGNDEL